MAEHPSPFVLPESRLRRRHVVLGLAGVLAVAVVVTAVVLFVWVDSYAPLSIPAYGTGGDLNLVKDESGQGGDVAVLSSRPTRVEYDFTVNGRWPVTLESISTRPAPPDGARVAIPMVQLMAWDMSVRGTYRASALHIRLARNGDARLFVTFRANCRKGAPPTYSTSTKLAVRYRYLRYFTRTAIMDAPFAFATPCAS